MFYLFLISGIIYDTLCTLSINEALLMWLVLLTGYLAVDYLRVVKEVAQAKDRFQDEYQQKMEAIFNQLQSAQVSKVKQAADHAIKGKSA